MFRRFTRFIFIHFEKSKKKTDNWYEYIMYFYSFDLFGFFNFDLNNFSFDNLH